MAGETPALASASTPPGKPATPTGTQVEEPKAAVPAPAATPPDDGRLKLARFNEKLNKRQGMLDKREAELKDKYEKADEISRLMANAKRNTPAFMRSLYGDDWEAQIAAVIANKGQPTPELIAASVDERLEQFKKEQTAEREKQAKAMAEAEEKRSTEELASFKAGIATEVKSAGKEFALVNALGAHEQVFAQINAEYQKTGKVLTTKEAGAIVETNLRKLRDELSAALQEVAPPPPVAETKAAPQPIGTELKRKTLSNDMTASASAALSKPKATSDAERMARAKAVLDSFDTK